MYQPRLRPSAVPFIEAVNLESVRDKEELIYENVGNEETIICGEFIFLIICGIQNN